MSSIIGLLYFGGLAIVSGVILLILEIKENNWNSNYKYTVEKISKKHYEDNDIYS